MVRAAGFGSAKLGWMIGKDEMDIFLEPQSKPSGSVLDEEGSPVAEGRLMLSWGSGESMNLAIDEAEGTFAADGLVAGKYRLNVLSDAGPALFSEMITPEEGKAEARDIRVKRPSPGAGAASLSR